MTPDEWSQVVTEELRKTAAALDQLHQECSDVSTQRRQQARDRHNRKRHVKRPNFEIGDYVLVANLLRNGNKLNATWKGPKRIVGVVETLEFEVQDMLPPFQVHVHHA